MRNEAKVALLLQTLLLLEVISLSGRQVQAALDSTLLSRRTVLASAATSAALTPTTAVAGITPGSSSHGVATSVSPFRIVTDPESYSALAYSPPPSPRYPAAPPPPLLFFLHGAGRNQADITNLVDPRGEYAGLLPNLMASGRAPSEVMQQFAVLAPYSFQQRSFYNEPRSRLLQFLTWACSDAGRQAGCPVFDPLRVTMFGFSDGATVAVELLTTRRFAAGVVCSYGFTGTLPDLALQLLKGLPLWIWHSSDDAIFSVQNSDRLVHSLRTVNGEETSTQQNDASALIRYTRFDEDPENFGGSVRGHTTGITAARDPKLYQWLLSL